MGEGRKKVLDQRSSTASALSDHQGAPVQRTDGAPTGTAGVGSALTGRAVTSSGVYLSSHVIESHRTVSSEGMARPDP